jgi:hypothetical protein
MRKEYDFSGGVRGSVSGGGQIIRPRKVKAGRAISDDDAPLSEAQIRGLRRRLADLKDPVRYLIVSEMGPRFALYYNVADDLYGMNDLTYATLFKRRAAALAVRRLLGRGTRVIQCTTQRRKGLRVPVLHAKSRRRQKGVQS